MSDGETYVNEQLAGRLGRTARLNMAIKAINRLLKMEGQNGIQIIVSQGNIVISAPILDDILTRLETVEEIEEVNEEIGIPDKVKLVSLTYCDLSGSSPVTRTDNFLAEDTT